MSANVSELPFYFHFDRDYSLHYLHIFQQVYPALSLFTWHPLVLYFLIRHPGPLSKEIRAGYIANQICLMLNEFVLCVLVRVYPIMPYPAFYCDGPLCQLGLPQQAITTFLAAFVILPNPPFEFLLLCMHQKMVANTTSRLRFSNRVQNGMMYTLVILLILNVVGFGIFGAPSARSAEIANRSDLSWLTSRGGQLLIFGDIGSPDYFKYECYFLASTLVIVFPVVVVLSIHATHIIQQAKSYTTNQTIRLQNRIMVVILIQLHSVFLFYIFPLTMLIMATIFPFPAKFLGYARPIITVFFTLNPMPLSLVFLFKNGIHREIMWKKLKWLIDCRIPFSQSQTTVGTQFEAFSHLPSTSITRSVVI